MVSNTLKTLGAVALLSVMPAVAHAAQPTGNWRGLIMQANTDVAAEVTFIPQGASMHFAEPFACNVPAKLLKEVGGTVVYRFGVSRNGGRFCDSLMGRDLNVTMAANGRMQITFDSAKATWRGDFQRMGAP
jgi:hypothetical protein